MDDLQPYVKRIITHRNLGYRWTSNPDEEKEVVLFARKRFRNQKIEQHGYDRDEDDSKGEIRLRVQILIVFGKTEITREFNITCSPRTRHKHSVEQREARWGRQSDVPEIYNEFNFYINRRDYEAPLQKAMDKAIKTFCLDEKELIKAAYDIIKIKYKYKNMKYQVEIGGRIIDALLFMDVEDGREKWKSAKIIGFEAKTDKDNYSRLYHQIDAYQNICDEVYLIIESKEVPLDLPNYVGIIQVKRGVAEVVRWATTLKHYYYGNEFWGSLMKGVIRKSGLRGKDKLSEFFVAVETLKRKLIWNQFVLGFHQTYVEEYIPIDPKEMRMLTGYFTDWPPLNVKKKNRK